MNEWLWCLFSQTWGQCSIFSPSFLQKYRIWLAILDAALKAKTIRDEAHSFINRNGYLRIQCFNCSWSQLHARKESNIGRSSTEKTEGSHCCHRREFLVPANLQITTVVTESSASSEVQIHIRKEKTKRQVSAWDRRYTNWNSTGLGLECVILCPNRGLFK